MKFSSSKSDIKFPAVMGILNVTPDSFSDGGDFYDHDSAVAHARKMVEEGADIIDIGGESSRPGAEPITQEEELSRVVTVISAIRISSKVPISIDTVRSAVAEGGIKAGADMVNDISAGTFDGRMFSVVAKYGVPICLMHMRGAPKTMQSGNIRYVNLIEEVSSYLKERAAIAMKAGVKKNNIMIDPGIGFGKTAEHNIELLKNLKKFSKLGYPVLIGTSRKSFIGKVLGTQNPKDRLEGSLATVAAAYLNGASIFRVHDVRATKRFLNILKISICRK